MCFITAGPITKLFAWGREDGGGHVLRETTSRGLCGLVCPSHTSERGLGLDVRVLLARIKVEVRQVQVCKWTTTIEDSLEPLCRLTHSIIQARRCRRVTMWSRSLVGTSNRARQPCVCVGCTNSSSCSRALTGPAVRLRLEYPPRPRHSETRGVGAWGAHSA